MVERWSVKPEAESSSLSGIAKKLNVNCFKEKEKVCREQKIFTPKTQYRQAFS